MSSLDQLYPVHGGPFDGDKWPRYEKDIYVFGDGDYLFIGDVWCWSVYEDPPSPCISAVRYVSRALGIIYPIVLVAIAIGLFVAWAMDVVHAQGIGESYALTYQPAFVTSSTPTHHGGIGEHAVGQTSIGTQPSKQTQTPGEATTGDITYPNSGEVTGVVASKPTTLDTPEARLRQAYEYCLTDFKGTQGIVMDGSRVATASFSDPNCAKIAQRWEGSQAQKHYNAELADWNRQRIAREKVLIDQVAGESEGRQRTGPRPKQ